MSKTARTPLFALVECIHNRSVFNLSALTFLLKVGHTSAPKTILFPAPRKVFEKFGAAGAAHIADCAKVWRKWSKNERFESQFYHAGEQWNEIALIPLTSGSRGASVVAVRRDESFPGRDKGLAFGERTLRYCG